MIDVTNLPDGFYWLTGPSHEEPQLVKLYASPEYPYRVIGYGSWDGSFIGRAKDLSDKCTLTPANFMPPDGVVKTPSSSTVIINISEKHVEEKIVGYITKDAFVSMDQHPRKALYKVVERKYRHPAAPEHAMLMREEVVLVDEIIPELSEMVHVLGHMEDAMLSLMNKHCQE